MPDNAEANAALFSPTEGLTFDDVVVVPGWSTTLPDEVDTSTVFAAGIELAVPLVSAAMDKVTEARMAIAMARVGGIGVIHRNMSAEAQAAEVQKVKRSQSGMITDPVTLPVTATLADAEALMHRFKFSGVPITSDEGRLIGILTNRDIRFCEPSDFSRPVSDFMTSENLVTGMVGTSLDEAKVLLQRHRIEKLPLVDESGRLAGLITVKDIQKRLDHPDATRDDRGRLRCAAACGVGADVEERVEALVAMGVDAVSIDTAHGHCRSGGDGPPYQIGMARSAGDGRQCGDGGGGRCPGRGRGRRGQGGCGRGVDLHHAHRQRCGHAAADGDLGDDSSGPGHRGPDHRRRRHHLFGGHREGDRRRS